MFSPDDVVGQELKNNLTWELQRRFNIGADASDYADYIVMLMATGKSNADVVKETNEISLDMRIDEPFVAMIYQEAQNIMERLQQQQQQQQQPQQPQQQQQQQPPQQLEAPPVQPPSQPQPAFPAINAPPAQPQFPVSIPTNQPQLAFADQIAQAPSGLNLASKPRVKVPEGPKGSLKATGRKAGAGGVGKKQLNTRDFISKQRGPQKTLPASVEKAMAMSDNQVQINQKPRGRCPDFPNCPNKDWECPKAHPTRMCYSFPKCPNPPGTCKYLHPGEDDELIATINKRKAEWVEKKKAQLQLQAAKCKFGAKCAKDLCPYIHPTPANPDAVIATLDWCPDGKLCQNPLCVLSHPPPPTAKSAAQVAQEVLLEQCKFGKLCTNPKCGRRHAVSLVPCKFGNECRNAKCTWMHPINEPCKFGANCKNAKCYYQHPEGRQFTGPTTWTREQQFAVPEDQVMEQVTQ